MLCGISDTEAMAYNLHRNVLLKMTVINARAEEAGWAEIVAYDKKALQKKKSVRVMRVG